MIRNWPKPTGGENRDAPPFFSRLPLIKAKTKRRIRSGPSVRPLESFHD
jgi:hypothetical protein